MQRRLLNHLKQRESELKQKIAHWDKQSKKCQSLDEAMICDRNKAMLAVKLESVRQRIFRLLGRKEDQYQEEYTIPISTNYKQQLQ